MPSKSALTVTTTDPSILCTVEYEMRNELSLSKPLTLTSWPFKYDSSTHELNWDQMDTRFVGTHNFRLKTPATGISVAHRSDTCMV